MKVFEIITEADARLLPRGSSVGLAKGGHVTPLARDTLRERRVIVVEPGRLAPADAALAPPAIGRIAVGSDHTGLAMRRSLVAFLRARGLAATDLGTHTADPVDYPDIAALVAKTVVSGEADAGIVIDGAGIGSAIAANKVAGIRAVAAWNETVARYAREHNGANVLTLGATLMTEDEARAVVAAWLGATMREPRYIRRLAKIRDLERS